MPRFGKDKSGRNEELDRQAAEEVERLTRRGGPPGMGGGSGAPEFMSSPLDMIAAEMAEKPRPSQRREAGPRKVGSKPQQAFTPMPSGSVGSSFGPGGLNPGPRGMAPAAPPPAFGGGAYDDDYGGPVTGPPVYNAEPDEDEEITITELALMDQAAHTGHRPEDLVMQYDASTAEEMRDAAMRQFYERQQSRRPGPSTNSPFAPAGMRRGSSGGGGGGRSDDPAAAGGALAQRLANRRRREEEEARRAKAAAEPAPAAAPSASASAAAKAEKADDEGALARVLARRRQALGVDAQEEVAEDAPGSGSTLAPGRRHASSRAAGSPGLRAVPQPPDIDEDDADDEVPAATKSPRPKKAATKAPAAKKATKTTAKAPAAPKAGAVPARKRAAPAASAAKATKTKAAPAPKSAKAKAKAAPAPKATKAQKSGATLAKAPAAKTAKAAKARTTGKAKTVFCIECGEKNPAIAKFCFNCGNRLAVPEG